MVLHYRVNANVVLRPRHVRTRNEEYNMNIVIKVTSILVSVDRPDRVTMPRANPRSPGLQQHLVSSAWDWHVVSLMPSALPPVSEYSKAVREIIGGHILYHHS